MTPRRGFLILNVAAVFGLLVSLFIVPGNTPFWLWCVVAVLVLAVLNIALMLKFRRGSRSDLSKRTRTAIIALGAAFLLLDIILSRYFR
jgi:hypothetical protein